MFSPRVRFLLALLLGLTFCQPGLANAQKSWPVDNAGVPAPPCTVYDPTTNTTSFCTSTTPIPVSSSPTTPGGVSLGSGAAYFGGTFGTNTGAAGPAPTTTIFTPDSLLGVKGTGGAIASYLSPDLGATWLRGSDLNGVGVMNNPGIQLHLTTSATPRYLISGSGAAASVYSAANFTGVWTASTGLAANRVTALASQGSTVLAVQSNAAGTLTQACRSTNDGATFGFCVTVDPAAGSIPDTVSPLPILATPAPSIYIVGLTNGTVWRTANDGATWTQVFTGVGRSTLICLSSTRCLGVNNGSNVILSNDAGVTWVISTTTPATTGSILTMCGYDENTATAIGTIGLPTVSGSTTTSPMRTVDGGLSFTAVPVTASQGVTLPMAAIGPCTVRGTESSFALSAIGFVWTFYGGPSGLGSIIVQSGARADACNLGVTATGVAGAAVTATLPIVSGFYHYICTIEIRQYAAAALVGGAVPTLVTSTNLTGSNAWTFQTALAIGTSEVQTITGPTPIKVANNSTTTTVVAPATANVIWRINVYYYTAAQ